MYHRGSPQSQRLHHPRGEGGGDDGRQRDRQRTPQEGVGGIAAKSPAPGENFHRSEKRSEQTVWAEAEAGAGGETVSRVETQAGQPGDGAQPGEDEAEEVGERPGECSDRGSSSASVHSVSDVQSRRQETHETSAVS